MTSSFTVTRQWYLLVAPGLLYITADIGCPHNELR